MPPICGLIHVIHLPPNPWHGIVLCNRPIAKKWVQHTPANQPKGIIFGQKLGKHVVFKGVGSKGPLFLGICTALPQVPGPVMWGKWISCRIINQCMLSIFCTKHILEPTHSSGVGLLLNYMHHFNNIWWTLFWCTIDEQMGTKVHFQPMIYIVNQIILWYVSWPVICCICKIKTIFE